MPKTYDTNPKPLHIFDNAPDQTEINIIGSPDAFEQTNTGFNIPELSLFESEGGKTKN
jgi:hypothetical protein